MSYPDETKFAYSNYLVIETASHYRYVQPAPSPVNTAKALLVYRQLDDGIGKNKSSQVVYPGSPAQLLPGFVYLVRADINTALTFPESPVADVDPAERNNLMVILSDEYRPVFGGENHFSFRTEEAARLPTGAFDTQICARFPNPGAKRIGFWFTTVGAGNSVVAQVIARGVPSGSCAQTVIGPGHLELVHVVGNAEVPPIDWEVQLTATGVQPTSVLMFISYNEEA
jgi:hypothetical protein